LEELKSKYKTFVGKAVFVDHNNENVENARGIIIDAAWNDKGKFVELLKAIDKKAYPDLGRSIEKGYVTDTSMGCRCAYSICSICGNEAHSEDEFCEHIISYKGMTYNGLPVFEDNRDIEFFEDSMVVEGADPEAKILEKVAKKIDNRAGISINTFNKQNKEEKEILSRISNEKNQRSLNGRINSLAQSLSDISWT
jgi:hypothetical protein